MVCVWVPNPHKEREWKAIDLKGGAWISLARIILTVAGLFLAAAGLFLITVLSTEGITVLVAVVTIAAAVVSLLAPPFPPTKSAFLAAGAVTGISETATGVGGPPMGLVYQHSRPAVLRSTVATCFSSARSFCSSRW